MRFCTSCGEDNGTMKQNPSEVNTQRIKSEPVPKSNKGIKKKIIIAAVIAVLIISCIVGIVFKSQNGGKGDNPVTITSSTNTYNADDYKSAYVNILSSILRSNASYLDDEDYKLFGILNLDNDRTPELLVNYSDAGSYFTEFYYFNGKEAKRIGRYGQNRRPYQNTDDEAYCYFIPQKGTLIEVTESYDGTETQIIYKYKEGQVTQEIKIAKTDPNEAAPLYFVNDRVVSYDDYQKEFLKYNPEELEPGDVFDDDFIELYELTQPGISDFYSGSNDETQHSTYVEAPETTKSEYYSEPITETTTERMTSLPPADGVQYLFDIETFTGAPEFEIISVTDTFDNEYKRMYRKNSAPAWGGDNEFSYLLDGKYSKITGTMIWAKAYKNDTSGYYTMEFYDGDKLLYETDKCSYISGPINFSLNVTGIKILTVKFNGFSNQGNFDFVTNITID